MTIYRLLHPIGKGGMGNVYRAEQLLSGKESLPMACKIMHGELSERDNYVERFMREVKINLRVSNNHRGLVSAYHYFTDTAGRRYLSMELVEGCNLRALLKHNGRIPFTMVHYLAHRILEPLAHLHESRALHRDLSPCNVLLSNEGDVKISDLGLAKELIDGEAENSDIPGKLSYASPESVAGKPTDPRSDLYSFAAMLYELLTTSPPFGRGLNPISYNEQLRRWNIPALADEVPDDIRALTMGLLRKEPDERRPRSAAEALQMLQPVDEESMRQELARMVRPVYEQTENERKRQPREQNIGPVSAIDDPVLIRAADPHADTQPEEHDETGEATASADDALDDEASLSGPQRPDDAESQDGTKESRRLRLPGVRALAMVALLVLGFLAHGVLDAWRAGSAPTTESEQLANEQQPDVPAPSEPEQPAEPDPEVIANPSTPEPHAQRKCVPPSRCTTTRPTARADQSAHSYNANRVKFTLP